MPSACRRKAGTRLRQSGIFWCRRQAGPNVPLSQLAKISLSEGPAQISREDGLRRIGIEMNIEGRDIGSFVAEAKRKIAEKVKLPSGYYLTWGGQFENQQRAMAKMMIIGPVAIGLILLLLFATFRSIRLALLVILNLPFALIGGVFSLVDFRSIPVGSGFGRVYRALRGCGVERGGPGVPHLPIARGGRVGLDARRFSRAARPIAPGADDCLDCHIQLDTHALRRWSRFGNPETPRNRGGRGIDNIHASDAFAHPFHVWLV